MNFLCLYKKKYMIYSKLTKIYVFENNLFIYLTNNSRNPLRR